MRVLNQGYLAQAWADVDRSNRIREARLKARGTVCKSCLRPIASFLNRVGKLDFYFHPELQDGADDAKNALGIYCEGRMEAEPA